MLHELFPTTRQTTKISNVFANNMSTDVKLSQTQISKVIPSVVPFGSWLVNLGKKVITAFTISLAKENLPGLVKFSFKCD